jgi:hypothetical protein
METRRPGTSVKEVLEARLLARRVRLEITDLRRATGLGVSANAEQLIRYIISGIVGDPHPQWRATAAQLRGYSQAFLNDLQQTLARVAHDEEVTVITTFGLLHWLSQRLDTICPIQKT